MRKRRNLADKLMIMMCAVLIAVSAFFYAPMEVEASYDEGYENDIEALSDTGEWKSPMFVGVGEDVLLTEAPFYAFSYGTIDRELYQDTESVWFYNDVPGTHSNTTTFSYNLPIYRLNDNSILKIDSNTFEFMFSLYNVNPYLNINVGNAYLSNSMYSSKVKEAYVVYNGKKYYGQLNEGSFIYFDFIVETVGSPVYLDGKAMSLNIVVDNEVFLSSDTSDFQYVGASYTPNVHFTLGTSSYAFYVRPFVEYDNGFEDSMLDGFESYDEKYKHDYSTLGEEFETNFSDFHLTEETLWTPSETILTEFSFFDLTSVPAMVTGISFVGSVMSGWFESAGGVDGVGIVLSILFSVVIVAMVLGLYRWYQSKGGKK